ncbi:MAG: C10 family peptidase, partial [Dysgonamonadaceae bacterium]|nr:C10 family peptidase [Dysgonamonadaceae bacterium]
MVNLLYFMDKFKYLFFLLGLMLLNLPLQAKKVNIEKAEKIAKAHVQFKQPSNVRKKLKLSHTAYHKSQIGQPALRSSNEPEDALYYIFNVPDEQGFIIVSGDDVAVPILGYSDEGNYDKSVSNPNFKYWIECLEQEIEYAVENNIPQSVENQALWQNYLNGNDNVPLRAANAVSPLIQTRWNQGSPYSDLCPSGYYTGCVATAMAQIMKYHRTPTTRTVTIPAYTTTTNQTVIPEITGSTTYDWSSMTNTYNASSSATTKTAVATLMYHYGAASKMDYTSTGSGAFTKDAGTALVTFFGYDKGIQYKQRNYYSNDAWHSLLLDELNAGRPIFYGGENSSDGHAFVCDGYDGNGKFHFNWGWSGMYDGYFVTTALNPGTGGAGAGSGTYNQKQEILINIKANEGGEFNYEIKIKANTNITSDKTSVARGETFSVSAPVFNRGLFNFTGNTGIALADANDQIIAILAQYSTSDLPPNYGWNTLNYTCSVPATVIDGNYRLRAAFKPSGSSQWTISTGSDGYVDV